MQRFDYIIVGAGSAGCTLANRLSADPDVSVCLIEAGKKDSALAIRMPAGIGSLIKEPGDYTYDLFTEPQKHMNGRKLWWPRGKGWGGSSSINGMIYIRGHARDYDQWAQMGLKGWSHADVLPYFKRSEGYEGGDTAHHGGQGPLKVTESPLSAPIYGAFIQAGEQAGYALTNDFNGANQEGFGRYQRTIYKGERWSSSFGYLRPIEGVRKNLTVMSTGRVTRILLQNGRAVGVEVVSGKGKIAEPVLAEREVIVSAGAVHSPQILQLSGIGDPEHLSRMGIECQVESKGVGANLQDHLDVTVINEMSQPASAYSTQNTALKKIGVGLKYLTTKKGPGADQFLQAGAFVKSRPGLEVPDLQWHLVNAVVIDHGNHQAGKDGFTIHTCQLRPDSRGTVCLGSKDPFAAPLIDPNYLATEEDRRAARDGLKMIREVCETDALRPWCKNEMLPGESVKTDEELDAFVRRTGETIYHPVGTVAMGAGDSAPLDGELRVRGVEGLRVVDASVMPTLIGGNTNAPTMMIAEKAADMMLGKAALVREEVEVA